jgi:hypothetical protein
MDDGRGMHATSYRSGLERIGQMVGVL